MSTKIGTTLGGGVSCGTNIGGGVTTLVVDTIFGSGSSPLGSRKETLRFAAGTGGNRGFGAGVRGRVGSSGDGVGGSIGDLGIQLEKMSRSLENFRELFMLNCGRGIFGVTGQEIQGMEDAVALSHRWLRRGSCGEILWCRRRGGIWWRYQRR